MSKALAIELEYNIVIVLFCKQVFWCRSLAPVLIARTLFVGFLGLFLLDAFDLFKPEKFLSVQLIQFGIDVGNCVFGSRNDNMLAKCRR